MCASGRAGKGQCPAPVRGPEARRPSPPSAASSSGRDSTQTARVPRRRRGSTSALALNRRDRAGCTCRAGRCAHPSRRVHRQRPAATIATPSAATVTQATPAELRARGRSQPIATPVPAISSFRCRAAPRVARRRRRHDHASATPSRTATPSASGASVFRVCAVAGASAAAIRVHLDSDCRRSHSRWSARANGSTAAKASAESSRRRRRSDECTTNVVARPSVSTTTLSTRSRLRLPESTSNPRACANQ